MFSAHLEVLRPESVQALGEPLALVAAAREREPLRALVVDDSLVARVFLTRLLERRGYVVEQAADAAECWSLLPEQRWSALFIDVALPDANGRQHIADVVRYAIGHGGAPVVALIRDDVDAGEAHAGGARSSLRKPFEADTIDLLLQTLPIPPTTERTP